MVKVPYWLINLLKISAWRLKVWTNVLAWPLIGFNALSKTKCFPLRRAWTSFIPEKTAGKFTQIWTNSRYIEHLSHLLVSEYNLHNSNTRVSYILFSLLHLFSVRLNTELFILNIREWNEHTNPRIDHSLVLFEHTTWLFNSVSYQKLHTRTLHCEDCSIIWNFLFKITKTFKLL